MPVDIPVLIIGAGPVGLTMAIELCRQGIDFRIIDKQIKPIQTSNAVVILTKTLEIWDDMGILQDALKQGIINTENSFYFDNKKRLQLNFNEIDSVYKFKLILPQPQTESIMLNYLHAHNINVDFEVELIKYQQEDERIIAILQHKNGKKEVLCTEWLIGCDGIHSTTRKTTNLPFLGKEFDQPFLIADVEIKPTELFQHETAIFFEKKTYISLKPLMEHLFRIAVIIDSTHAKMFQTRHPDLEAVLALVKGYSLPFEIVNVKWASVFKVYGKIVASYRKERIFLVGDAAHINSPISSQGMNTGLQDAYNLAWKLALFVKGRAKESLLNSYHDERYPIGKKVLVDTTKITQRVAGPALFKFIRKFILSKILGLKFVRKKFLNSSCQLTINYSNSSIVKDFINRNSGIKAGFRMKDTEFTESGIKKRLFDYVQGTQHCLLMFCGNNLDDKMYSDFLLIIEMINKRFPNLIKSILIIPTENEVAKNWHYQKIVDKNMSIHNDYGASFPCLYLIRPDKYIGFRCNLAQYDLFFDYLNSIFI